MSWNWKWSAHARSPIDKAYYQPSRCTLDVLFYISQSVRYRSFWPIIWDLQLSAQPIYPITRDIIYLWVTLRTLLLRFLIKESFTIPFASFTGDQKVTWSANFPRSSLVVIFHDHVTCLWQATLLELHLFMSHKQLFYNHVSHHWYMTLLKAVNVKDN